MFFTSGIGLPPVFRKESTSNFRKSSKKKKYTEEEFIKFLKRFDELNNIKFSEKTHEMKEEWAKLWSILILRWDRELLRERGMKKE